jgi:hypothetical protein
MTQQIFAGEEFDPGSLKILVVRPKWNVEQTWNAATSYAFAFLCNSTVLHVLSAAWQRFSSGQSTHFGLRA